MKLGIMQPYFFPYLGYFQLIHSVDKFILYDNVNYIKKGWIHRNRILENNRDPIYIIVPVKKTKMLDKISDVVIDNSIPWKKKILDQIYFNYKHSISFDEVYSLIKDTFNREFVKITDLNKSTIQVIANYLQIKTEISDGKNLDECIERDLHEESTYGSPEAKQEMDIKARRIISICQNQHADMYINAIGGKELYNREHFAKHHIDLRFIKTVDYSYNQNHRDFFPDLSIIDLLMNNKKSEVNNLLHNYELI